MSQQRRSNWPYILQVPLRQMAEAKTWHLSLRAPRPAASWFAWSPPTDVFETDDGALVRVEIAGLSEGTLDVSYADGRLVIDGQRRDPLSPMSGACSQKEIASGRFRVDVIIPWRVDPDGIRAAYADGFLTVALPRAERG